MSGHHPWSRIRDRSKDSPERTTRIEQYRRDMEVVIQLKRLRADRGFTQVDETGVLNVARHTVPKVEREGNPDRNTIRKFADG